MKMSNLGLLKQQLRKISAELSALPTDDLSDYKASIPAPENGMP